MPGREGIRDRVGSAKESEEPEFFFHPPFRVGYGMAAGNEEQVLPDRERGKEQVVVENGRYLPTERHRVGIDEEAVDSHVSGQGSLATCDGPGYRRLPGTVHPHDSEDFAGSHRSGYLSTHWSSGISHKQAFGFQY
ncbi:hypothetical protein StoSoilB3_41250 [Arthrobacter sp. StoSoilB3]|nr:hypothetical protein StoSoilB3_41250 [Arthrobacter sp. StoSoilB3]